MTKEEITALVEKLVDENHDVLSALAVRDSGSEAMTTDSGYPSCPSWWDAHKDEFVGAIAKRLALRDPWTCGDIMNSIERLIHDVGALSKYSAECIRLQKEQRIIFTMWMKDILHKLLHLPRQDGWDICNECHLDEDLIPLFDELRERLT